MPNMQYRRWYPNATTLSDGRILVVAGWQTCANTNAGISEIYDPVTNAWTSWTNADDPFETYPFMYLCQMAESSILAAWSMPPTRTFSTSPRRVGR